MSSSPTWVLPGAARVCVADGEGGTRGLCNAGSHVCSLPGCAAERGPGLRSRAASRGWARCGPGRASRAPGRPGKGLRREGVSRGLVLRLAPARPKAGTVGRGVGFLPRKGGLEAPSGDRGLRAGAAWRARSGGGHPMQSDALLRKKEETNWRQGTMTCLSHHKSAYNYKQKPTWSVDSMCGHLQDHLPPRPPPYL